MACSLDFIEFVSSQIATAGTVRYRKMFGEYMIYVDEKPVIIVCDNIPYVKEHEAIKSMMLSAERGFPYEGAKEMILIEDIEDKYVPENSILRELIGGSVYTIGKQAKINKFTLIIVLAIAVLVSQFKFPPIMVIIVGAIAGNIWMMNRKGAK